jgi:acyl-CoA reductase-like NAD-dependent aldehyde dehydrogenase
MESATEAFKTFRLMPAPQRGEIVRQFGEKLREKKEALRWFLTKWEIFEGYGSSGND